MIKYVAKVAGDGGAGRGVNREGAGEGVSGGSGSGDYGGDDHQGPKVLGSSSLQPRTGSISSCPMLNRGDRVNERIRQVDAMIGRMVEKGMGR